MTTKRRLGLNLLHQKDASSPEERSFTSKIKRRTNIVCTYDRESDVEALNSLSIRLWEEVHPTLTKIKRRAYKCPLGEENSDYPKKADFYYAITDAYQFNESNLYCSCWCEHKEQCKQEELKFYK